MKINPRLIIGLGNPGKEYEKTYHSVGFLAIDYLAKNLPISNLQFLISKPLKSNVYMNESGNFVKAALKKYKIKPEELIIIHDDSDIELGKYKISFGKGSAGHKGVQSIIDALKTKNFWRLRIGIRKKSKIKNQKSKMRIKAGELVLKKISQNDLKILFKIFEQVADEFSKLNQ